MGDKRITMETPNFEEILKRNTSKRQQRILNDPCSSMKGNILSAMKEAWNLAIEKAAEEAKTDGKEVYQDEYNYVAYKDWVEVDKQSILKLKI